MDYKRNNMITAQKFNRRGYGNRPFKNYSGIVYTLSQSVVEVRPPWYIRLINWFKQLISAHNKK